jgi:thiol-disulfide isomerase/thioredoxin
MTAPCTESYFSWKTFLAGGCLGVVLGCGLLLGGLLTAYNFFYTQSVTKMAETKELRPVEFRADYAWTLTGLDGAALDLQSLQGRPIFLHLWRPECVSCLAEVPGVNALYAAFDDRGIAFVSVALDPEDDLAATLGMHDVRFPVYTAATKDLPDAFKTSSTPTTYIIDSAGFIVYRHAGAVAWDSPDARDFLERLGGFNAASP